MDKLATLLLIMMFVARSICAQETNTPSIISTPIEASLVSAAAKGGYWQLKFTGTVPLTKPLVISKSTIFEGVDGFVPAMSASNLCRLFVVQPGVKLTLKNLTMLDGHHTSTNMETGGIPAAAGGFLYNNGGDVVVSNSIILNHDVIGQFGADGNNSFNPTDGAPGESAVGGAIFSRNGSVLLSGCVLNANGVQPGSGGRGADAVFVDDGGNGGNAGQGAGGAVFIESGNLTIFNSLISSNLVLGALGGLNGLSIGVLTFDGIAGEASGLSGAGVYLGGGATGVVSGSTLAWNAITNAGGQNGAIGKNSAKGQKGRSGGSAFGGGILNDGVLRMTNCTVTANMLSAANGGVGGAGIVNGFGTDGGDGGAGGSAQGAGLCNIGTAFVQNCTFSGNKDKPGTGGAGGVGGPTLGRNGATGATGAAAGANLAHLSGLPFNVVNSLLDNPLGGTSIAGNILDLGGNLNADDSLVLKGPQSANNVIINLLTLAYLGGLTPTMSVAIGSPPSPALGIANPVYPVTFDQRGVVRPTPSGSGSFELASFQLQILLTGTNQALLTWPVDFASVDIQRGSSLPASTNWTTLTNKPFLTNFTYQALIALDTTPTNTLISRFFQLKIH